MDSSGELSGFAVVLARKNRSLITPDRKKTGKRRQNRKWERVAGHHQVKWKRNRSATSLKKKWNTLHNAAPPTGDPNVSENVKWALRIKSKIADRANLIGETENDDLDIGLENEGNEIEIVVPDESQEN